MAERSLTTLLQQRVNRQQGGTVIPSSTTRSIRQVAESRSTTLEITIKRASRPEVIS
jgi:hypothetical protein